jgi:hypothetical protein
MVVRKKKPPKTGERFVVAREVGKTSTANGGNTIKKFVLPMV